MWTNNVEVYEINAWDFQKINFSLILIHLELCNACKCNAEDSEDFGNTKDCVCFQLHEDSNFLSFQESGKRIRNFYIVFSCKL